MKNFFKNIVTLRVMNKNTIIILSVLSLLTLLPAHIPANTKAKLIKVPIQNGKDIKLLQDLGLELLIIEDDYIVVRANEREKTQIEQAGFVFLTPQEQDLVMRLIRITYLSNIPPGTLATLYDMGLDIWEVQDDYIIAQVFDKQIRLLQKVGFVIEILYRNARDFVNQQ
ncbi:hypothetical protein KA005_40515 [bacterium]|nr:hypothetical protein [bacterium]